jgi:hypothetical protein
MMKSTNPTGTLSLKPAEAFVLTQAQLTTAKQRQKITPRRAEAKRLVKR